jgi:hypothetical protein
VEGRKMADKETADYMATGKLADWQSWYYDGPEDDSFSESGPITSPYMKHIFEDCVRRAFGEDGIKKLLENGW